MTLNSIIQKHATTIQQDMMLRFMGGHTDAYYLMSDSFVLEGVDPKRLQAALETVTGRHDILRATFEYDRGSYAAHPVDGGLALPFSVLDSPTSEQSDALAEGDLAVTRPIDLSNSLPWRMEMRRLADDIAVLNIAGHHLVFDGWCFKNFYAEISAAYAQGELPVVTQYHEAAAEGRIEDLKVDLGRLRRPFRGIRRLSSMMRSGLGVVAIAERHAGVEAVGDLRRACAEHKVTPYAIAVTGFAAGLSEVIGDREVVLGSASTGRTTADAVRAMGYFSNSLFITSDNHEPRSSLESIWMQLKQWQGSPRVQWETVLDAVNGRDLYAVKFAFERAALVKPSIALAGVSVSRPSTSEEGGSARRALDVSGALGHDRIELTARYRTDALEKTQVEKILDRTITTIAELSGA